MELDRKKVVPTLSKVGFGFGIVSIFLYSLGIIPLIGIIVNIIALSQHKKAKHKKLWLPVTGLILSVVYLIVNLGFRYAKENGYM